MVNMADYFHYLPSHYSKKFLAPSSRSRRKPHLTRSSTNKKIEKEEEEDLVRYGKLTKLDSAQGRRFVGPFVGHFSWQSRYQCLREGVRNLEVGRGLQFRGSLSLSSGAPSSGGQHKKERLWYEQPSEQSSTLQSLNCHELRYSTNFKQTDSISVSNEPAITPSSSSVIANGVLYTSSFLLPTPDSHVTHNHALIHLDCSTDMVTAYYGNQNRNQSSVVGTGVRPWLPQGQVELIVIYHTAQQSYTVTQ